MVTGHVGQMQLLFNSLQCSAYKRLSHGYLVDFSVFLPSTYLSSFTNLPNLNADTSKMYALVVGARYTVGPTLMCIASVCLFVVCLCCLLVKIKFIGACLEEPSVSIAGCEPRVDCFLFCLFQPNMVLRAAGLLVIHGSCAFSACCFRGLTAFFQFLNDMATGPDCSCVT